MMTCCFDGPTSSSYHLQQVNLHLSLLIRTIHAEAQPLNLKIICFRLAKQHWKLHRHKLFLVNREYLRNVSTAPRDLLKHWKFNTTCSSLIYARRSWGCGKQSREQHWNTRIQEIYSIALFPDGKFEPWSCETRPIGYSLRLSKAHPCYCSAWSM